MITRRRLLIAGAAAAGTAAAGVAVVGPDRLLHAAGATGSPDHHPPRSGWPVAEHTIVSRAMGRPVRWAMAVPARSPVGVVIALHGRNGDRRDAFDDIRLHDMAAEAGLDLAVASVDGGAHSYWHKRADGIDALSLVLDELMPAVDAVLGRTVPRALLGWSMGGYGALLAAERAPARFRAVAAASPALWPRPAATAPGAFDGPDDYQANDVHTGVADLAGLTVRVDCGTSDGFVGEARRFAASLPSPNPGGFTPGYHDVPYWRSIAPAQLRTIATAL